MLLPQPSTWETLEAESSLSCQEQASLTPLTPSAQKPEIKFIYSNTSAIITDNFLQAVLMEITCDMC
jgi:hypothetical protein